jgi:hypothetical protein
MDGFQLGVPNSSAQMTFSVWKAQDVPHSFELKPVWVHVDGVPHTVRHFLGLWAVGSLIGTTLDVDLVSLRSLGVVRILVAMMEPKTLDKFHEVHGCACLGVSVTVKLKGYDLYFRREQPDFVADPGFTPFFWKKKGDDSGNDGTGPDTDDMDAPRRNITNSDARMDVDTPQSSNISSHGKTVLDGSSCATDGVVLGSIDVTPLNPNPTTPRGKEIVAEIRSKSPGFIAKTPSRMVSLESAPLVVSSASSTDVPVIQQASPLVSASRLLSPALSAHSLHAVQEVGSLLQCMESLAASEDGALLSATQAAPSAQSPAAREAGGLLAVGHAAAASPLPGATLPAGGPLDGQTAVAGPPPTGGCPPTASLTAARSDSMGGGPASAPTSPPASSPIAVPEVGAGSSSTQPASTLMEEASSKAVGGFHSQNLLQGILPHHHHHM